MYSDILPIGIWLLDGGVSSLKALVEGMSFSSGVQGSLRGSSCFSSFELCAFSFVWFLEAKKKCSSRSADLSFLCNFQPISSPFLHEQSKAQNSFILVFIIFFPPLGCRVGLGKRVIRVSTRGAARGQSHLRHRVLCCWARSFLPLLHLLGAAQPLG